MKTIYEQDTKNIRELIDNISQLNDNELALIPQFVGHFLCHVCFYDSRHESFVSRDVIELLQKFAYLCTYSDKSLMKKTHQLIQNWNQNMTVNDESLFKYHRECDKLKKELDA